MLYIKSKIFVGQRKKTYNFKLSNGEIIKYEHHYIINYYVAACYNINNILK